MSDSSDDPGFGVGLLVGIGATILVAGIVNGCTEGKNAVEELRLEAVRRGYAKWSPDENGHSTFSWIGGDGTDVKFLAYDVLDRLAKQPGWIERAEAARKALGAP